MEHPLEINHIWDQKQRKEILKIVKKYIKTKIDLEEYDKMNGDVVDKKTMKAKTLFITFWKFRPSKNYLLKIKKLKYIQ